MRQLPSLYAHLWRARVISTLVILPSPFLRPSKVASSQRSLIAEGFTVNPSPVEKRDFPFPLNGHSDGNLGGAGVFSRLLRGALNPPPVHEHLAGPGKVVLAPPTSLAPHFPSGACRARGQDADRASLALGRDIPGRLLGDN